VVSVTDPSGRILRIGKHMEISGGGLFLGTIPDLP
jgi:hypothetical protein